MSAIARIRRTFALDAEELAQLLGTSDETLNEWETRGVPTEREADVRIIAEIAEILHRRVKADRIADVVRRPAHAYGGRTMLEAITQGNAKLVLDDLARAFDYSALA